MIVALRHAVAALACCALAACAGTPAPTDSNPTPRASIELRPAPPPAPPSLAPWAGRYSVTGAALEDDCGGEVILAAGEIEIDPTSRTLRADVVDREYDLEVEGDGLVATGRFPVESQCPESTVYERWELAGGVGGALEGELLSTWLTWPGCMRVCTVRFGVRAEPL